MTRNLITLSNQVNSIEIVESVFLVNSCGHNRQHILCVTFHFDRTFISKMTEIDFSTFLSLLKCFHFLCYFPFSIRVFFFIVGRTRRNVIQCGQWRKEFMYYFSRSFCLLKIFEINILSTALQVNDMYGVSVWKRNEENRLWIWTLGRIEPNDKIGVFRFVGIGRLRTLAPNRLLLQSIN